MLAQPPEQPRRRPAQSLVGAGESAPDAVRVARHRQRSSRPDPARWAGAAPPRLPPRFVLCSADSVLAACATLPGCGTSRSAAAMTALITALMAAVIAALTAAIVAV